MFERILERISISKYLFTDRVNRTKVNLEIDISTKDKEISSKRIYHFLYVICKK